MASIGKVALDLVSGEAALALANFNFNFSVVKMEAPRKFEAEEGKIHETARKLGALFADDLPAIPKLSHAYGLRTSEIASNKDVNPKGEDWQGPLASYVGADGTSIWAAATSGRGAIHVHLLACMLARIWSAPEAFTIWTEMVAFRKVLLARRIEQNEYSLSALTASHIELARADLAEWDASARSWLRSADTAKSLQQTQLMLIIDNIGVKLTSKPKVYDAVHPIWINALNAIELIVCGVAQTINKPEVLLALSSWHLYPDMYVAFDKETFIDQKDKLIPKEAPITLGLHGHSDSLKNGITWSLPLSRLCYYGKPQIRERVVAARKTRVPFSQLLEVAFGATISKWSLQLEKLDDAFTFTSKLFKLCYPSHASKDKRPISWFGMFAQLADQCLALQGAERAKMKQRVTLGYRLYGNWFSLNHPSPYFGLNQFETYLQLLRLEDQISLIRKVLLSAEYGKKFEYAIIRYIPDSTLDDLGTQESRYWDSNIDDHRYPEFASIAMHPVAESARKIHRRWILGPSSKSLFLETSSTMENRHGFQQDHTASHTFADAGFLQYAAIRSVEIMSRGEPCGFLSRDEFKGSEGTHGNLATGYSDRAEQELFRWETWPHIEPYVDIEILKSFPRPPGLPKDKIDLGWGLGSLPHRYGVLRAGSLSIWLPCQHWEDVRLDLDLATLQRALDESPPQNAELMIYMETLSPLSLAKVKSSALLGEAHLSYKSYKRSLESLFRAALIYWELPSALVDLSVAEKISLEETGWDRLGKQGITSFTRAQCFACIATFESGNYNLDAQYFSDVVALSSGNSLYVSELLISDPTKIINSENVQCLVGNIGKPGIALILLAKNPEIQEAGLETWEMVTHALFDGKVEDNFRSTSVHLNLTGDEVPLNVDEQGVCDKEISYVEAVVGVYERGKWTADLNVLALCDGKNNDSSVEFPYSRIVPPSCQHSKFEKSNFADWVSLTAIDCWSEFLDHPTTVGVIRARENWPARLAFAACIAQMGHHMVICSDQVCWACVKWALGMGIAPGAAESQSFILL